MVLIKELEYGITVLRLIIQVARLGFDLLKAPPCTPYGICLVFLSRHILRNYCRLNRGVNIKRTIVSGKWGRGQCQCGPVVVWPVGTLKKAIRLGVYYVGVILNIKKISGRKF